MNVQAQHNVDRPGRSVEEVRGRVEVATGLLPATHRFRQNAQSSHILQVIRCIAF